MLPHQSSEQVTVPCNDYVPECLIQEQPIFLRQDWKDAVDDNEQYIYQVWLKYVNDILFGNKNVSSLL